MELMVHSWRVTQQNNMTLTNYDRAMLEELNDLYKARLATINHVMVYKWCVSQARNKKVKHKSFDEGELVWKVILPFGHNDKKYGKWASNWEGPFTIDKVLCIGAYLLRDCDSEPHREPINEKYLKKCYPTKWESLDIPLHHPNDKRPMAGKADISRAWTMRLEHDKKRLTMAKFGKEI